MSGNERAVQPESKKQHAPEAAEVDMAAAMDLSPPNLLHLGLPAHPSTNGLRQKQLLQMQRSVGNRATLRHLGVAPPSPHLQRQPTPGTATSADVTQDNLNWWNDNGGPDLISAVQADCASWRDFRKNPLSFRDMPGKNASKSIGTFLSIYPQNDAPLANWIKFHASSQVDSQNLAYLQEMASLDIGFNPDVGRIFNVSKQSVKHDYTCKTHAAVGVAQGAVQTVAAALDVTYKNSLGINWSRTFFVPGVNFSLGLSVDPSPVDVEYDPTKPNRVQPSVEKDLPVSPGVNVGLLQINLEGEAKSKSDEFYGLDDLEGSVQVIAGPAAEYNILDGGNKISLGSAVGFMGPPVPVWFEQWEVNSQVSGVNTQAQKGAPKAKVSLVGLGAGVAIGGDSSVEPPPEHEPQIVSDFRQGTISWSYPTGDWVPPDSSVDKLMNLKKQIRETLQKLKIEADQAYLKEKGIELSEAMALNVEIVGRASRSWRGAKSDQERVAENEALAQKRADTVKPLLETLFSDHLGKVTISATGAGPGTKGKAYDNEPPPDLSDPSAQQTYLYEQEKVNKQYDEEKQEALKEKDPVLRQQLLATIEKNRKRDLKEIETRLGPQSDVQESRRVDITVTWNGKRVAHELPGVPKQAAAKP